MKLSRISANMISHRPDQTAEWLNRLKQSTELLEEKVAKGGGGGVELKPATTTTLGGIIVGDNLTITSSGRLSAAAPSGTGTYADLPDKPKINGVTLINNKTLADLDIIPITNAEIDAMFA